MAAVTAEAAAQASALAEPAVALDVAMGDPANKMRRSDTRREVSERVVLRDLSGKVFEGWALNVSRGGVRCIVEDRLELGAEYDLIIGDDGTATLNRRGRIVWVQEENDGCVAGFEFLHLSGLHRAATPAPPSVVNPPPRPEE